MKPVRLLLVALVSVAFCTVALSKGPAMDFQHPVNTEYPKTDKRHYLSEKHLLYIRPGLNIDFTADDISIAADGSVSVTFSLTDDNGQPLDIEGNETPGPVRVSWVLSYIPEAGAQYISYFTRNSTSSITGESAIQATSDSGGSFTRLDDGVYRYDFGGTIPADYDASATHTVGVYASRDLGDFDLGSYIESDTVNFIPAGGEVVNIRDVVTTESCNNCHDQLTLHGRRRGVDLCILCHYDGVIDPDTGNDVDFQEMVHKIHQGENLPSVQAGTPYQIIGFRNSVHDYSHVVFPQDVRNCTTCHTADATQGDNHKTLPTRITCGSCHDDVIWETGENHIGGPQVSDSFCANCHFPEGELEFDASVVGAHTIPSKSNQLDGINVEFLEVTNTQPGANPTVRFTLTNNMGDTIDASELDTFRLSFAGPTTDYESINRETATSATPTGAAGEYTYTFQEPLPSDAEGSFTVSVEIRERTTLNAGTTTEVSLNESTYVNPTFNFAVTDSTPVPRRMIVDTAKCNNCHDVLSLHGGQRFSDQYCVMCHSPGEDDSAVRPDDMLPAQSIDFKFLIHRIHTGEELLWDYTIYGFRGSVHNYNEVLYPGDRRNCLACHTDSDSYQVPSAGVLPTLATENEFFSPIQPESAACLGCHDDQATAVHAFNNAAAFGEACGVCHGEGAEFSVDRVHARNE